MTSRYRDSGDKSNRPALLPGSLFYRYATEVFSSGNLAPTTYGSVVAGVIAVNDNPAHDNGSIFLRRFLKQIKSLFVQGLSSGSRRHGFKGQHSPRAEVGSGRSLDDPFLGSWEHF
jgi:hypothetical protein